MKKEKKNDGQISLKAYHRDPWGKSYRKREEEAYEREFGEKPDPIKPRQEFSEKELTLELAKVISPSQLHVSDYGFTEPGSKQQSDQDGVNCGIFVLHNIDSFLKASSDVPSGDHQHGLAIPAV